MQPRPETLPGKKRKIRSRSSRRRVCVRGRSAGRGGAGTLRDPAGLRSAGSERGQRSAAQHKTRVSRPPPSFMRRRRLPLAALPRPRPAHLISAPPPPRAARAGGAHAGRSRARGRVLREKGGGGSAPAACASPGTRPAAPAATLALPAPARTNGGALKNNN